MSKSSPKASVSVDEDRSFSTLCEYACRYVLGRMTYAPSEFQWIVRDSHEKMTLASLKAIRSDVMVAIEQNRAGDPRIDVPGWVDFLKWIEEKIKERTRSS